MRTTSDQRKTVHALIKDIRTLLYRLERFGVRDGRSLDQEILDLLSEMGPSSTPFIIKALRRGKPNVYATLRLLVETKRVVRRPDLKWELAEHV